MIVTDGTLAQALPLSADAVVEQDVTFTAADLDAFARLSGDRAAVHFDQAFATSRGFSGRIVHGLLIGSRFSRLMGMFLPGEESIIQSLTLQYRRPITIDTPVRFRIELDRFVESVGAVVLKLSASSDGEVAAEGRAQCVLRTIQQAQDAD